MLKVPFYVNTFETINKEILLMKIILLHFINKCTHIVFLLMFITNKTFSSNINGTEKYTLPKYLQVLSELLDAIFGALFTILKIQ